MADPQDPTGQGLLRGGTVGRYILLSLLGKGGMGIVYAAYDPELDRKVALKLLRVRESGPAGALPEKRARLLREAKAMARLSHPNVITVYDVGAIDDQVFIAMELVDGLTLTRWRELLPRSWKEVLGTLSAAGQALAAAHAAGLVHRDFKPDNVMVSRDGKVRVMDFGLARQVERPAEEGAPEPLEPEHEHQAAQDAAPQPEPRLTHDGVVVGTPAYMPPEQYMGVSNARTDQFSFCVALYECLYGDHPFSAKTAHGIVGNAASGRVPDPPANSRVPLWLRKVVLRGLRPRPEERYPSMEALLVALGRDPAVARRRWIIASGLLVAFGAVAFAARQAADTRQALCAAGPERIAAAWELPVRRGGDGVHHAAVKRAFLATGKSYAAETLRGTVRALDDYAARWLTLYRESCEATRVHGDQSEEVLDLKMACLNDRLGGLKALTDIFSDATGEVVERAVDAAHALTPLDGCTDVRQLRALIPPPDPGVRARVEALRRELTRIKAVHDGGRFAEALKRLQPVANEARSLGYAALQAEVMTRVGLAEAELHHVAAAETAYDEAFMAALASHHDDLIADLAANLVWVTGFQERFAESDRWTRIAEAALERAGRTDPVVYSWLLNNVATIQHLENHHIEALEYSQKALALKEKALGPDNPDVAITVGNIALFFTALGRGIDALRANDRALRIMRLSLGNSHPRVADQLNNRGEILASLGRPSDALIAYGEAQGIFEREFGRDDPTVAYALTGAGTALLRKGRATEAVPLLEQALSIREQHDPDAGRVGETSFALARAIWETHSAPSRAMALARKALESYGRAPLSHEQRADITAWLEQRTGHPSRVAAAVDK